LRNKRLSIFGNVVVPGQSASSSISSKNKTDTSMTHMTAQTCRPALPHPLPLPRRLDHLPAEYPDTEEEEEEKTLDRKECKQSETSIMGKNSARPNIWRRLVI
jgi:hypothetical protein